MTTILDRNFIIALSGRKGAGKNTVAKFIATYFRQLYEKEYKHWLKNNPIEYSFIDYNELCHECSFADTLKQFCITALGLTYEQCYGSDEQKNQSTVYQWDNLPEFLRWKFSKVKTLSCPENKLVDIDFDTTNGLYYEYWKYRIQNCCSRNLRTGFMTGRDVMQVFGTELVRETFGNVWAESTIRRIKELKQPLSIISDNRFPNEIEAVLKESNAYIIRLTRSPYGFADEHESEKALDNYNWSRNNCFILNNSELGIEEQNKQLEPVLKQIFMGDCR